MFYIDAEATKPILNPPPESFRFVLTSDGEVNQELVDLFASQLNAKIKDSKYTCSIFDFITFGKQLKDKTKIILSESAQKVLGDFYSQLNLIRKIKEGEYNNFILPGMSRKFDPWDDQKAAISFLTARGLCGNFSDVGLGKTYCFLYWYSLLRKQGKVRRGLILCTNSIKNTWNDQMSIHFDGSWTIVRNGTNKVLQDIDDYLSGKQDILVVHYDALVAPEVTEILSSATFDVMVCDESHTIQNLSAERSKAILKIKHNLNPNQILFMSATPISESPTNAFCFLKVIAPDLIPTKTRFEQHFCTFKKVPLRRKGQKVTRWTRWIDVISGYKNLDQLHQLLELYSFRKTHADVKGMPPTVRKIIPIEVTGPQRLLYDDIAKQIYSQIVLTGKTMKLDHALVRILRLRQLISHPSLIGQQGNSCKFETLDSLLEEVLSDPKAKVVVWSVWVDTIKLLTERYKKYNALPYFGEIDMEDRRRYETLFKDDDRYRVLVANPVVAGLGLNLQRARVAIHVDRSEKLLVNQQSDGRITRRDAIGTAVIIDLVGKDTIDEWLYEILKKKEDMQKSVLDPDAIPIDIEITSLEKYLRSPNGKGVDSSSSNIPKGLSLQNTLNS